MKIPAAKAALDEEWETFKKLPGWDESKVKSKKKKKKRRKVVHESKSKNMNVHFATIMDLYQLMYSELAEHLQNYKGSVVLRGDNVKDDTGGSPVFILSLSHDSRKSSGHDIPFTKHERQGEYCGLRTTSSE